MHNAFNPKLTCKNQAIQFISIHSLRQGIKNYLLFSPSKHIKEHLQKPYGCGNCNNNNKKKKKKKRKQKVFAGNNSSVLIFLNAFAERMLAYS